MDRQEAGLCAHASNSVPPGGGLNSKSKSRGVEQKSFGHQAAAPLSPGASCLLLHALRREPFVQRPANRG